MDRESPALQDQGIGAERWAPPPPPIVRRGQRPPLPSSVNLVLFLLTIFTTLVAGTGLALDDVTMRTAWDIVLTPSLWTLGLSYSLCLIAILGAHEMGHFVACRRYRIDATLPFFIPAPTLIGTFGAVIRIRSPFTTRRALFDIGVAGPIAGFVVALPVLAYGLSHSDIIRQEPRPGDIGFPSCLLLELAYRLFFRDLAPGEMIRLHPMVVAAWVGILATFLNLIPVGQLDGGHMLYALSRRAHRPLSLAAIVGLIAAGSLTGGVHLIVFGILWAVIGARHPLVLDETDALGPGRVLVALLALAIFILCFIPASLQVY